MSEWVINWPAAMGLAILHCIVGMSAAVTAHRRGLGGRHWLLWGLIGGTVALIAALVIQPPESSQI